MLATEKREWKKRKTEFESKSKRVWTVFKWSAFFRLVYCLFTRPIRHLCEHGHKYLFFFTQLRLCVQEQCVCSSFREWIRVSLHRCVCVSVQTRVRVPTWFFAISTTFILFVIFVVIIAARYRLNLYVFIRRTRSTLCITYLWLTVRRAKR